MEKGGKKEPDTWRSVGHVEDLADQEVFLCALMMNGPLDSPAMDFWWPSFTSFATMVLSMALFVGSEDSHPGYQHLHSSRRELFTSQVSYDLFSASTFHAWAATGRL